MVLGFKANWYDRYVHDWSTLFYTQCSKSSEDPILWLLRSSLSKMVERDEVGSAFSVLGIVQALLPLGRRNKSQLLANPPSLILKYVTFFISKAYNQQKLMNYFVQRQWFLRIWGWLRILFRRRSPSLPPSWPESFLHSIYKNNKNNIYGYGTSICTMNIASMIAENDCLKK